MSQTIHSYLVKPNVTDSSSFQVWIVFPNKFDFKTDPMQEWMPRNDSAVYQKLSDATSQKLKMTQEKTCFCVVFVCFDKQTKQTRCQINIAQPCEFVPSKKQKKYLHFFFLLLSGISAHICCQAPADCWSPLTVSLISQHPKPESL